MNVLILTDSDLDGSGAALLINKLYSSAKVRIEEVFKSDLFRLLKSRRTELELYDVVYLLDIDPELESIPHLSKPNFVIIDHHETHMEKKKLYKECKVIVEVYESCAKLIYDKFKMAKMFNNPELDSLIKAINGYDCYSLDHPDSLKLNAIHRTYNRPKVHRFIKSFSEGLRPYTALERNSIKIYFTKLKNTIDALEPVTLEYKGDKIVAALCSFGINEVAHYMLKTYKAQCCLLVNITPKMVSIRCTEDANISACLLAETLGDGGGHIKSAGCKLTDKTIKFIELFQPC